MLRASFYITLCTAKNRVLVRLLDLNRERALKVGTVAGVPEVEEEEIGDEEEDEDEEG